MRSVFFILSIVFWAMTVSARAKISIPATVIPRQIKQDDVITFYNELSAQEKESLKKGEIVHLPKNKQGQDALIMMQKEDGKETITILY